MINSLTLSQSLTMSYELRVLTTSPKQNMTLIQTNSLLSTIQEQVLLYSHSNVILATISYRYDLRQNSYETRQISNLNNAIRGLTNKYLHLHLLDLWCLSSRYHTHHGLHINMTMWERSITIEVCRIIDGNWTPTHRSSDVIQGSFTYQAASADLPLRHSVPGFSDALDVSRFPPMPKPLQSTHQTKVASDYNDNYGQYSTLSRTDTQTENIVKEG